MRALCVIVQLDLVVFECSQMNEGGPDKFMLKFCFDDPILLFPAQVSITDLEERTRRTRVGWRWRWMDSGGRCAAPTLTGGRRGCSVVDWASCRGRWTTPETPTPTPPTPSTRRRSSVRVTRTCWRTAPTRDGSPPPRATAPMNATPKSSATMTVSFTHTLHFKCDFEDVNHPQQ